MIFKTVAVALIAFTILPASAQDSESVEQNYNAETMFKMCEGTHTDIDEHSQSLICTFRFQGLVEVMRNNCESIKDGFRPHPTLSAGGSPSRGAIRQSFKNYMEAHPELWGEYWMVVAALAVSDVFPCEN